MLCLDFHFWRECTGGCRKDGLEIGRQEAGTGVQVSNDRASSLGDNGGGVQKEKDVWYMTAVTQRYW